MTIATVRQTTMKINFCEQNNVSVSRIRSVVSSFRNETKQNKKINTKKKRRENKTKQGTQKQMNQEICVKNVARRLVVCAALSKLAVQPSHCAEATNARATSRSERIDRNIERDEKLFRSVSSYFRHRSKPIMTIILFTPFKRPQYFFI